MCLISRFLLFYHNLSVLLGFSPPPAGFEEKDFRARYLLSDESNDAIMIRQDEDITKTQYVLPVKKDITETKGGLPWQLTVLCGISVFKKGQWIGIEPEDGQYKIVADFEDKIEKIRFSFVRNLAEDYTIDVRYQEADKARYYARKEQERIELLLKTANITTSTGANLVNIYFQPCCEAYKRTEILLYRNGCLLKKYRPDEDYFFLSIVGLAYGSYEFVLKQYGDGDTILLETNKISFSVKAPRVPDSLPPNVNGNW